ncbi:MAG: hypothetical protein KGN16_22570 [Burkholderiales bacterium]|nr:hypothetical protein [Burkholderiales bacterium]
MTLDDDLRAPPASAPLAPAAARPARRPLWPWLLALGLLLALLAAAGAWAAVQALGEGGGHGLHLTINGDEWDPVVVGVDHPGMLLAGLAVALVAVLVIVPLALLLALLSTVLGVGIALLVVLAVVAGVASPLWLPLLLLWLLLRPRGAARIGS